MLRLPLRAVAVRAGATAIATLVAAPVLTACDVAPTGSRSPSPAVSPSTPQAALDTARPVVLAISVDGLNTRALTRLGRAELPHFHRLLHQGARTLNARTEYEQNVTLPNHTGMMTGRRIDAASGGHGVTWDRDRRRMTVARAAGHPVSSVFSVVHGAGGSTALFSAKEKFGLYHRSWPRSICRFTVERDQMALVRTAAHDLVARGRDFTFLHISLPDRAGHAHGGMSSAYLQAVRRTDEQLGIVLRALDRHRRLERRTTIILTADHGFAAGTTSHARRILANYRIPFLVWGDGVRAGDLYRINPDYADPGTARPGYAAARQPIRNGDLANLALTLLDLRSVPGSELDALQDLRIG
ncbi:MAG: alkaline phosphatase family protein [Nocardioides sp.]|uniref:alkaline phosphatase family protein n=1 Tax=Nocardioides sp. TaxID=35761 RepID=UPI0039E5B4E5